MPLRLNPVRGGFTRATGLGEFIRLFLSGELEAPVLDPDTRELTGFAQVDPRAGAPAQDIWARYKDFLFVAWGQELVQQWRRQGREVPEAPGAFSEVERTARARIPQRLTGMRLNSFYRYFRNLRELGWVEFTGQEEGSLPGGSPGDTEAPWPRRYYRLTRLGLAEAADSGWRNPLLTLYPERGPEYYRETARRARERKGKLPPKVKHPEAAPAQSIGEGTR